MPGFSLQIQEKASRHGLKWRYNSKLQYFLVLMKIHLVELLHHIHCSTCWSALKKFKLQEIAPWHGLKFYKSRRWVSTQKVFNIKMFPLLFICWSSLKYSDTVNFQLSAIRRNGSNMKCNAVEIRRNTRVGAAQYAAQEWHGLRWRFRRFLLNTLNNLYFASVCVCENCVCTPQGSKK